MSYNAPHCVVLPVLLFSPSERTTLLSLVLLSIIIIINISTSTSFSEANARVTCNSALSYQTVSNTNYKY